jgi:hypothetical protein
MDSVGESFVARQGQFRTPGLSSAGKFPCNPILSELERQERQQAMASYSFQLFHEKEPRSL